MTGWTAVLLSGIGLAVTVILWLADKFWLKRKIISYRVEMDELVDLTPTGLRDIKNLKLTVRFDGQEVEKPSMVLLRIKNSGSLGIKGGYPSKGGDFTHRLRFMFGGREVVGYTVTQPSEKSILETLEGYGDSEPKDAESESISGKLAETPAKADKPVGITVEEGKEKLVLPRLWFNRGQHFKLFVLVSGDTPSSQDERVSHSANIADGKVIREPSMSRLPSKRSLVFAGISIALASVLVATLIFKAFGRTPTTPDVACGTGNITLEGSTAFAPVAEQIVDSYESACPGATVHINPTGSLNGINELNDMGGIDPQGATERVAMSDVPAPTTYTALTPRPIAILVFTVVINKDAGIDSLTQSQIQDIYQERYSNWSELGGNDVPIRIVGRNSGSGTRRAFEEKVLHSSEPPFSSDDCQTTRPQANTPSRVPRCERGDTRRLLETIHGISGAIGYAEVTEVRRSSVALDNLIVVQLNGHTPDLESIRNEKYLFWVIEYFYTYGPPKPPSPVAAFMSYMTSEAATKILRREGYYVPCIDSRHNLKATVCR